jgi:hypothetical protein
VEETAVMFDIAALTPAELEPLLMSESGHGGCRAARDRPHLRSGTLTAMLLSARLQSSSLTRTKTTAASWTELSSQPC